MRSDDAGRNDAGSTSRSLLVRLRKRDEDAWRRLVSLYGPLVLHWCQSRGLAADDAADVAQEVLHAVLARLEQFQKLRPADTFRGWLRTITRNKIADHFRSVARRPRSASDSSIDRHAPAEAEEELASESRVIRGLLHRALAEVKPCVHERTWLAFWRFAIEGRSPTDVGAELSMSAGAVRVAKARVLQRLRLELGDRPEDSNDALS